MTLAAILVLAVGTYAIRFAGPVLRTKVQLTEHVQQLLAIAATTLLLGLVVTAAVADGQEFAGWARPAGVAVGGVLAWRRAPFVVIVIGAACTTALLRLAGLQ